MWRLQIGAATACSRATTRMPSRGRTIGPAFHVSAASKAPRRTACQSAIVVTADRALGDAGSAGEDRVPGNRPVARQERTDPGARLRQDDQRRGHVPQVDVQLDIGVGAPGGDIGQPQRTRAVEPRHRSAGNDAFGEGQEIAERATARPAQFHSGARQIRRVGGPDGGAVQRRAGTRAGGEGLVERGRHDHADHRHVAVHAAQRDAEPPATAHEVGRPVDRIDHPAQTAGAGASTLLALEAIGGVGRGQALRQQALDRAVCLGEPVLGALQRRG